MFNFIKKTESTPTLTTQAGAPTVTADNRLITKIFIVEDNDLYAQLLQHTLESEDKYDIHLFSSAEELFKNIHHNPDIVTID